jgi:hypothetical protein
MSKTKFNGFENYFIIEALKHAIEESEQEIQELLDQGKRPIFAPGYFELIGRELITKINNMTLKRDRQDLQK